MGDVTKHLAGEGAKDAQGPEHLNPMPSAPGADSLVMNSLAVGLPSTQMDTR